MAKNTARTATRTARRAAKRPAPRKDLGAPIDGYFARQPPPLREVLVQVRAMIVQAAPDAESSIKWGMPFFSVAGKMMCALTAHKAHVNLNLPGAPGTYPDPKGLLEGEGKTGKHLAVRSSDELPAAQVRKWLAIAARQARAGVNRM
jgi:hypothetical protein